MRRASRQIGLGQWGLALLAFLGVGIASLFFFHGRDSFRGVEKLDVVSYSENAKSFQGGNYWVEGEVGEALFTQAGMGNLISLGVSSSRGVVFIPVLVPETLQSFNLQKGQSLKIKVKGMAQGLLRAEKMVKSE